MRISVEISPGELYDKISILQIKKSRITDKSKLKFVLAEHTTLVYSVDIVQNNLSPEQTKNLTNLLTHLETINDKIWDIEDNIRECERRKDFGSEFIQLARSVYLNNDERARIKKDINTLFDSDIQEAKSYADYE
jgi:hypothetical protein